LTKVGHPENMEASLKLNQQSNEDGRQLTAAMTRASAI
jgi:hypothetical protein